jgi:hypothetical protein
VSSYGSAVYGIDVYSATSIGVTPAAAAAAGGAVTFTGSPITLAVIAATAPAAGGAVNLAAAAAASLSVTPAAAPAQGEAVTLDIIGPQYISVTSAGRAIRFLPALFVADKQNQLYDDISTQLGEGLVVLDLDLDGAKMTFTATLKTKRAISPFVDFVAPFVRILYEDGTEDYEQVGLYVLVPAPSTHHPGGSLLADSSGGTFQEIDGRDLCWLLASDHSDATTSMALGANVINDALDELSEAGITRVNIPASSYVSTKAVDWEPGTSRLQRVNDRLMMAGYYTVCFDRHGIAMSFPYRDLATTQASVTYTGDTGSRIVPPVLDEPDLTRLANRVVVIGTDPAQAPIYAIRENTDPLSPVSYDNLGGIWITRTEEIPDIQTQDAADDLADELIRNGASFYRSLTIQTLPDPTRNPREVYAVELSNEDGVVADGKWHCSGWELPLSNEVQAMTHFLNREEAFVAATP